MQKITPFQRALLTAVLLTGCSTAAVNHNFGEAVSLDLGATASFSDGLRVTFTRVVSDSRCPAGVTCIQAGEAVIELTGSQKDRTQAISVSSDPRRNRVEVLDHVVELMSVGPRQKYSVTLRATSR